MFYFLLYSSMQSLILPYILHEAEHIPTISKALPGCVAGRKQTEQRSGICSHFITTPCCPAPGPVVHHGRLSTSAGDAEGYLARLDKMSICDNLG